MDENEVIAMLQGLVTQAMQHSINQARLTAATKIAAAILANPTVNPLHDVSLDTAAAYAVALVEVIEEKLLPSPPPASLQEGRGGDE